MRATAYAASGQFNQAIAGYTKTIELAPGFADAHQKRGNLWGKRQEYDKAIADFSRFIELAPDKASVIYFKRGRAWHGKKEFGRAAADYRKALGLNSRLRKLVEPLLQRAEAGE